MNKNPIQAQFKVLNVEDDKFSSISWDKDFNISELLIEMGVFVVECENGLLAKEELLKGEHKFDLILLNVEMPVMDGLELLKYIKNEEQFKSIPVVMTSSDTEAQKIVTFIAAGALDYLPKPITVKKLKQCIESVRKQLED